MKLKAALLMVLVIFAATAAFFAFNVYYRQTSGMTGGDSVEHHHILQIGNQTICQIPIDTPGGPG
jgi:hypothetical protein